MNKPRELKARDLDRLQEQLREQTLALGEARQELRSLKLGLESRVRERTAALESRTRQLSRSNRDLAHFATAVSHDLQEPLRTLANHLRLLKQGGDAQTGPDGSEQLTPALRTLACMQRLVADLLSFSRLESIPVEQTEVDCNVILREVLEKLDNAIKAKQARINIARLPTVPAYAPLLSQLFQNLLDNALKFSGDAVPVLEIGAEIQGGEAILWVHDNGIGIPHGSEGRIFRLFQRLHGDAFPGTGMGLALCKKIAERHGGRIWVEPHMGQGSRFLLMLPCEKQPARLSRIRFLDLAQH